MTGPKIMPSEPPHCLSKKQPLRQLVYAADLDEASSIPTRPRILRLPSPTGLLPPGRRIRPLSVAVSYAEAFEIGSPMNVNPSEDPYFLSVSVMSWTVPIAFREGGSYPCGSGSLLRSTVMRRSLNQGSYVGNWPRD